MGTIYLLHFTKPLRHAQHYLGWTAQAPEDRAVEHLTGRGTPLVRAVVNAGEGVELVRTWTGDRAFERELKNRHNARGLCPICLPTYNEEARERMRALRKTNVT